ncbi:type II toxin-antitoxin system RelE family toxin [Dyadobacter sp. 32]|uniref:type II toxin-antitoxin system RelE family toxin n=1 Tax=Dyadobacter sp. 32 TaxID=538966 RepID=UPI0011EEF851
MYKIRIKKSALKELNNIQKVFRIKIIGKIEELSIDPRPAGVRKLENVENSYRIRVGDFRVIYHIEDSVLLVDIVKVAHRKEVYRNK